MLTFASFLLSSFLGLLCIFILLFRNRENCIKCVNKFLILIVLFITTRHLIYTVFFYLNKSVIGSVLIKELDLLTFFYLPILIYYYIITITTSSPNIDKKYFLFLITPTISFVALLLNQFYFSLDIFKYIVFPINIASVLFFSFLIIYLQYHKIWKVKSEVSAINNHLKVIKQWSYFITAIWSFIFIVFIFILLAGSKILFKPNFEFFRLDYIGFFPILWTSLFVYVIAKPEILYGVNFLKHINEDVETNKITFKQIWKIDGTIESLTQQKDIALNYKIMPIITDYIHKIEDIAYNSSVFRNKELTIEEFSSEVRIPVSHLKYLFTFHCQESFSDYKKIIRITDAIKILETDYIKTNTIESLSQEVGFKSYTTFFTAFKAVTGKSPQEFLR